MNYVFLTESELRKLIQEEISGLTAKPKTEEKTLYNMNAAVEYLVSNGCEISKSSLYQHTSKGQIDFKRFGERKIVFTKSQLDEFLGEKIK